MKRVCYYACDIIYVRNILQNVLFTNGVRLVIYAVWIYGNAFIQFLWKVLFSTCR
jgi:hypothetical protein